jgi:mutator protein MutT
MHPLSQFKFCPKCGSDKFVENNIKSKKCEKCGFVYYFNSCAATVAVIINENQELLVATRAHEPVKGTFDLPGGFVDLHETGEEAMSREVKEETGLNVDEIKYLFSVPNIYIYSGFEVHTLDLVYLCKVKDTRILKAEDDVAKLEFIKISELNPDLFGLLSIKEVIKKIQKMII